MSHLWNLSLSWFPQDLAEQKMVSTSHHLPDNGDYFVLCLCSILEKGFLGMKVADSEVKFTARVLCTLTSDVVLQFCLRGGGLCKLQLPTPSSFRMDSLPSGSPLVTPGAQDLQDVDLAQLFSPLAPYR